MAAEVEAEGEAGVRAARRRRWVAAAIAIGLCGGLGALWFLTPLRSLVRADALAAAGARLRGDPLALLWVVLIFVGASLVFVPVTPLMAATALIFDVTAGIVYGLVASTAAAWATWWVGKAVRRWRPEWLQSPRVQALCARLQRSAMTTAFIARILPIGSFTLFNIAAGAVPIPLGPYLVGSALGHLPRLIAFAAIAEGVGRATREPDAGHWITLGAVAAFALLALGWLRRRARLTSARGR